MSEGELFLREAVVQRDMLVQPYIKSVDEYGERALVWIAGEFTHAVRKNPRFAGQEQKTSEALPVAADEAEFGRRVLEPYARDLLYARVDVARDGGGALMVMELELVEPSLFLLENPRALQRLVRGCLAVGGRGGRRCG